MHVSILLNKNRNQSIINDTNQLWSGIRNGCKKSLSDLFCLYYYELYSYGYRIASDQELIKDCIQDLFLNIWSYRNNIGEALSVKAYLFTSLRRIILRKLYKKKKRYELNRTYVENNFQELFNIEELLMHFEIEQEKKKKFIESLNYLSNRQKEAVFLKFFEGFTNNEIADVMNINKQSVYNHISEAIKLLQQTIRNDV